MSAPQRTYWHLEGLRRMPSQYDIASSRLLYYPKHGFAIDSPVGAWYERYQRNSRLGFEDPERFRDPRETTYTEYTRLANERETFVDGLFRSLEETGYDRRLDRAWVSALEGWLPVLLYPCHGLQMTAAYVAQMAPAGRIVLCGLFQAADEMRRIQRLAYRVRLLGGEVHDFGARAKRDWQERKEWQPLRRLVEELLVTYDFGEAFVALCLVYKPLFDRLFLEEFARAAAAAGDSLLAKLFFSLGEDCRWHRAWAHELARFAIEERAENQRVIAEFATLHRARAREALGALEPFWPAALEPWSQVLASLETERDHALGALGVGGRPE